MRRVFSKSRMPTSKARSGTRRGQSCNRRSLSDAITEIWRSSEHASQSEAATTQQPLLERINFHQGIAGRVVLATHDGGVVAWAQDCKNRRFAIVRRRQPRSFDSQFLIAHPIVVGGD